MGTHCLGNHRHTARALDDDAKVHVIVPDPKILGVSMNQPLLLMASLIVGLLTGQAAAQAPAGGNPTRGHELALRICTGCHMVAPDQQDSPILRPPAPDFRVIANRRTTTADSLRTFISTTHASVDNPEKMSNPELTDEQTASIVAYILTLRKH